jgi:hypothetical protein
LVDIVRKFCYTLGTEAGIVFVEDLFKFFVNGIGHKRNTDMSLYSSLQTMMDWPYPQIGFADAKRFFNLPKVVVVLGNCCSS